MDQKSDAMYHPNMIVVRVDCQASKRTWFESSGLINAYQQKQCVLV